MLATLADFEARLGVTLAGVDVTRAEAALEDASALVLDEGDPDWTSATVPGRARQIVLSVALRVWRNPDGLAQSSVGDVSVSYSRTGVQGTIYLTKAEQRAVRKAAGRSFRAAQYQDPYPPLPSNWPVGGVT